MSADTVRRLRLAELESRRRLEHRDSLVHRCYLGCGEWVFAELPCPVCEPYRAAHVYGEGWVTAA